MAKLLSRVISHPIPSHDAPRFICRPGTNTTFLNPYSYAAAKIKPDTYKAFTYIGIDGLLLQQTINLLGREQLERHSFDLTSLAHPTFEHLQKHGKSIYVIGGTQADSIAFATWLASTYPKLNVSGCRHGYFATKTDRSATLHEMTHLNPNVVLAGMGTPLQDSFLADLNAHGWNGAGITCGGFIAQTATSKGTYYPPLINKLNLRSLYRIIQEPHTTRRYLLDYPKAMCTILKDLCRHRAATR